MFINILFNILYLLFIFYFIFYSDCKDDITKIYEIKDKLGTGSFAIVRRAIRKNDGEQFAVKVIKKSKLNKEELSVVHDEVEIMNKIKHENCVTLYDMYENSKKIYMVLVNQKI
jgi:calcium/calmodulin-dependent protein kinase I